MHGPEQRKIQKRPNTEKSVNIIALTRLLGCTRGESMAAKIGHVASTLQKIGLPVKERTIHKVNFRQMWPLMTY
jgi:hypothetical protein